MGSSNNSGRKKQAPIVEALEPRVLYSADTWSAFALLLNDSSPEDAPPPIADFVIPDVADSGDGAVKELVFIDSRVPDAQSIIDDVTDTKGESVLIVIVDHDQNGLELIQNTLSSYDQIESVHIVSHSLGEGVRVGNEIINERSLSQQQALFDTWGDSLTESADILLYGCDLASTDAGQTVIKELAMLTRADVAGSDDFTGSQTQSGDWALEYRTGEIETQDLISDDLQATWDHILHTWDGTTLSIDSLDDKFSIAAGRYASIDALIAHAANSVDPVERVISLREAIYAANNDPNLPADFTIKLVTPGTYLLTIDGGDDDDSVSDDLDIIQSMKIEGLSSSGSDKTTIKAEAEFLDGAGLDTEQKRVLDIHGDITVELSNVEITGGRIASAGAGIRVFDGLLKLDDVVIIDNRAQTSGGGIYSTKAVVEIEDSLIRDNHAGTHGGGMAAAVQSVLTFTNVEIDNNHAATQGGGIHTQAPTTIESGSNIHHNEAKDGAGIFLAHFLMTAEIRDSHISDNVATSDGGGAYVAAGTLVLGDGAVIDANEANNHAGGVFVQGVLIADSAVISNNISTYGNGGGIYINGTAELDDVYITANHAQGNGTNGSGGGIFVHGTVELKKSSLHANTAENGGGMFYSSAPADASIENVTFFDNNARDDGGAILVDAGVELTVMNATIANNSADDVYGAIDTDNGTVTISNSIVAANTSGGLFEDQLAAETISAGFNLITDGKEEDLTPHFTDIIFRPSHQYVVQPNLAGSLTNDGNSTALHLRLSAGSDAIDAGSGAYQEDGYGIEGNEFVDIGAVEYQATTVSQKVYFIDDDENAIYRMNEDGRAVQKIVESGVAGFQYLDIAYDPKSQHLFAIRYLNEGGGTPDEYVLTYFRNDGSEITGSELVTAGNAFVVGTLDGLQGDTVALTVGQTIDPAAPNKLFFAWHNVTTGIPAVYSVDIDYTVDVANEPSITPGIWDDFVRDYLGFEMRNISAIDVVFDSANPDDYVILLANRAPDSSPDFVEISVIGGVQTVGNINTNDENQSPVPNQYMRSVAYDYATGKVYFALNKIVFRASPNGTMDLGIGYNRPGANEGFDDILFDGSNDRVWFVDENGYIGYTDADLNLDTQPLQPMSVGATYAPASITLASVSAVNTPPRITQNVTLSINENDIDVSIDSTFLSSTDLKSDGTSTSSQNIVYTMDTKPQYGEITLNGIALDNGDTFTQADLDTPNTVEYNHFEGEESSDRFDFSVSDGQDGSDDIEGTFLIDIAPVNDSPVLTITFNAETVAENSAVGTKLVSVTLTDADGSAPYNVVAMQSDGLTPSTEVTVVDNGDSTYSVLLNFQPDFESYAPNPAEINFVLVASDAANANSATPFTLTVVDENDLPVTNFATLVADAAIEEQLYAYTIPENTFIDPDGDAIVYKVDQLQLPTWLMYEEGTGVGTDTGTFSGTPSHADVQAGQVEVWVRAEDGQGTSSDYTRLIINLVDVNQLPQVEIAVIDGGVATELASFNFTIPANTFSDPDGDTFTYVVNPSSLPDWLNYTSGSGLGGDTGYFTGTPQHGDVQPGTLDVEVYAYDGGGVWSTQKAVITITLVDINQRPVAATSDLVIGDATELENYTYTIPAGTFTDPDGDTVTYKVDAQALPGWLTYDEASGEFNGVPNHSDILAGQVNIRVTAFDGTQESTDDTLLTINLIDVNQLPYAANPLVAGGDADDSQYYHFTIPYGTFVDPDGDAITYSIDPATLPAWLTFTPGTAGGATGSFDGIPSNADVQAANPSITIYAVDAAGQIDDSTQLIINLNDVNQLPVRVTPTLIDEATELELYSYTIPAGIFTDPDGDPIVYKVDQASLPGWLSFDEASATFSGQPSHSDVQAGSVQVWIGATDGFGTASEFTVLTVNLNDVNQLPQSIVPTLADEATELEFYNYTIPAGTFTDPDGDTITYKVDPLSLPGWLVFDEASKTFSGTPQHADVQAGTLDIVIEAVDAENQLAEYSILTITLNDINQLPQTLFSELSGGEATEASLYTYTIPENTFFDPDGGPILYQVDESQLPSWLTYNQGSGVGADTGTFVGTPSHDDVQAGPVTVWIRASDGTGTSSDFVVLTISPVDINQLPVAALSTLLANDATELDEYNFQIPGTTFTDADGDALSYVIDTATLPGWLTFDQNSGTFTGTPQHADVTTTPELISVTVFDGTGTSVDTVLININVVDINQLPSRTVTSLQADDATELEPYMFQIPDMLFTDPDDDDLSYIVDQTTLPAWLSYSQATNTFTGTPQQGDVTSTPAVVLVTAFDGTGESLGAVNVTFNVLDINQLPVPAVNVIQADAATETQDYTFQIPDSAFIDPDGNALTYIVDAATLPAWLTYDQSTATFGGVPTDTDSNTGQPVLVEVQAYDGRDYSSTVLVSIPIANINQDPANITLSSSSVIELTPGAVVGQLSTADPDAADLIHTYQVVGDDRFEVVNSSLQLKPAATVDIDDGDSITVTLQSQDEQGGTVSQAIELAVENLNEPPVINSPVFQPTLALGASLDLSSLSFGDPDKNDSVSYDIQLSNGDSLPDWIVLDKAAQTLTIGNAPEGIESVNLTIVVKDALGETAEQPLFITVEKAPVLAAATVEEEPEVIIEAEETPEPAVVIEQVAPQEQPEAAPATVEQEIEIDRVVSSEEAENEIDLSSLIQPLETIELVELDQLNTDINSITRNIDVITNEQFFGLDLMLDLDAAFSQESDVEFGDIASEFDRQREELKEQAANSKTLIGSSFTISSGLSVGYLLWLIRGGTLMGSVLSSLPAWRLVDPLPVLGSLGDDLDGDDESLESMVSNDDPEDAPTNDGSEIESPENESSGIESSGIKNRHDSK